MFNFNFGKKIILGIDIGTSAIKVAEVELRNDKPYLSNYAWMALPGVSEKKNGSSPDSLGLLTSEYLKKLIKEAGIKKSNAYVSIPSSGGLITLIDFPEMPAKDMDQAIRFEAHKYIPTSLDEVSISWEILGDSATKKSQPLEVNANPKSNSEKKVQILLVAASKSNVMAYEKIIKDAGLFLKGVEIESISMVESLIGNDKGNFIIVDMGSQICNIIYVEKGVIKANRNINAGGEDITSAIVKSLGLGKEKVEAMKVAGKNFFNAESNLHFPSLDMVVGEISRILEILPHSENAPHIDAVIVSGGTANLAGFKEFLQDKLKIQTILGNPFSRLSYDKKLEGAIEEKRGRFAVCIGLALKGIRDLREAKK